MNKRLESALHALKNPDPSLKPVQAGDAREKALCEGLHGLAEECGIELEPALRIDARGEIRCTVKGSGRIVDGVHPRYGEKMAKWLNLIPVRTGVMPSQGHVIPEHNWCSINHFDVEKLILAVGKSLTKQPRDERNNSLSM